MLIVHVSRSHFSTPPQGVFGFSSCRFISGKRVVLLLLLLQH